MATNTSSFAQQKLAELNTDGHTNLIENFLLACETYGDKPAYSSLGLETSFTEIEKLSRNFASWLVNVANLEQGDRIAVQLPNLTQYPVVAWGALRAGIILVNTNPLYTEREVLHQFNDSGAKALVVLAEFLPMAEKVVPQTSIEHVIVTNVFDMIEAQPAPESSLKNLTTLPDALAAGAEHGLGDVKLTMDDIAVLQYTGGTTGVAKGAMLSQGNLFAGSRQSAALMELTAIDDEIMIGPMPLYHVYGFTVHVISGLFAGSLSVLIANPRDIDSLISAMKTYTMTSLAGVNTLFTALMQHPEFDEIDFSRLKGTIAGGTALVKEIAEEWSERTNSEIYEGYGLSETSAALTCNAYEKRQLGTVGQAMIAQEVKVVDDQGNTLPAGERGELLVRGPQVMQGYWQRPEATAESIDKDGWFATGDVAIIQQDGFISIVDRLKDMILVSGFNVYPNEIEDVVYTHPDIIEAAAVGIPDSKSGEAVKLFVVSTNPKLTEDDLRNYCREQLTAYKVPRHIIFSEDLPKSPVGKILRRELRDLAVKG
ncbi:MAG: AMP-binding protein [Pseudomonadales bacterium]